MVLPITASYSTVSPFTVMEWWLSQRDGMGSGGVASCALSWAGDNPTDANSNEMIDFTMMTP